jgi:DNA-binding LacI/PurR family transcriptional regulator
MSMPDYMRVRGYLYKLIAKADGKDMQMPSENELCRLFNVSRITVRGAIKGLVKDKFLIPKRGIGTFVSQSNPSIGIRNTPVVGVIKGGGRNAISYLAPEITACILESGMGIEMLFLPDSGAPERLLEIARAGMNAVIWDSPIDRISSEKYVEALSNSEIPFLLISAENASWPEEIDWIVGSRERRGVAIANYLHSLGHRNLLLTHNFPIYLVPKITEPGSTHCAYQEHMRKLCGEANAPHDAICTLIELRELLHEREAFLSAFSIVYAIGNLVPYIMDMLAEARISVPRDISLLLYGKSDPYLCNGLTPDYIDTETSLTRHLLEWLKTRVHMPGDKLPFRRNMEMDIVKGETVRNLKGRQA